MADGFGKLRKSVLREVQFQRELPPVARAGTSPRALGLFLDECLSNRAMTRADYAAALDMEYDLLVAILDGLLPAAELHTLLLVELALPLELEPAILLTMMGRGGEDYNDRPAHA
ncbi:MAG: hypothetical protein R3E39_23865 [Anaerolineae bacterium]